LSKHHPGKANGENLILISDLNGINNIYTKSLVSNASDNSILNSELRPITNSISGLYQLSLSKDTKKLVFSSLYESVFNIFMLDNPFEPKTELDTIPRTLFFTKLEALRNKSPETKEVVTEPNQNNILPDDEVRFNIYW
jgi:hypothetical protein